MIIKRHLIYVDAKTVKKIGREPEKKNEEDEIIQKAKAEAQKILENARKEADEILKDAQDKAQKILEDAKVKADEIVNSSKSEIDARLAEIEDLKSHISSLGKRLDDSLKDLSERLADASLPVFKVIYRKILEKDLDEDLAKRRIESALEKIFHSDGVILKISPRDVERLSGVMDNLKSQGFDVQIDPNLSEGDVLVETKKGVIDKTTSFRWKMIEDVLDEIL